MNFNGEKLHSDGTFLAFKVTGSDASNTVRHFCGKIQSKTYIYSLFSFSLDFV